MTAADRLFNRPADLLVGLWFWLCGVRSKP